MHKLLLKINGEVREVPGSINLYELLDHLSLAPERLAVELNGKVIRRPDWPDTLLNEGDRVEIVHFVGGGREEDYKLRGSD